MSDYYKIKYSSKDQFYVMVAKRLGEWFTQLEDVEKKINVISNMESFKGTTAESVKSYLNEVHNILLISVRQTILDFQYKVSFFSNGYYDIEPNIYATISSDALRALKSRTVTEKEFLSGKQQEIQTSINKISDLVQLYNPSQENILGAFSDTESQVDTLDKKLSEYESAKKEEASGDLADLIATLHSAINAYYLLQGQITGYQAGDYAGKTEILDLYKKVTSSMEYTSANQEAVVEANENIQEVFAQQQKDYEEACEARKDEGTANMIIGGLAVIGGVVAIVATAGAATPIVVVAAVSGSCAAAYGVSNVIEGAQDYYYGRIGDLSSNAWNPIRDTVFCGNQKLYDAWGNLSLTVASLCVPINSAVNSVAGASGSVIAKEVGKTIVKETVKDQVIDQVSEGVTNVVAEEFDLNKTERVILNTAIEKGLDKGVDAAEKAYVKHRDGAPDSDFTDKMSYEDAKRYNEFRNDPDAYRAKLEQVDAESWNNMADKAPGDTNLPDAKPDSNFDAVTNNPANTTTAPDANPAGDFDTSSNQASSGANVADAKPSGDFDAVSNQAPNNNSVPDTNSASDIDAAVNTASSNAVAPDTKPAGDIDTNSSQTPNNSNVVETKPAGDMGDSHNNAQPSGEAASVETTVNAEVAPNPEASQNIAAENTDANNSAEAVDYSTTANTAEERAVIADMEKNGEFNDGKESYGAVEVDPDLADPKEVRRRLPTENNGTIIGDRESGTFEYIPKDAETQKIMAKYGETTVKYNNAEPDFSPFTKHDTQWGKVECEVEVGHMVGSRNGSADNMGNYQQADIALSEKISSQTGQTVTPEQIKAFRESSGLTWHETSDGKTMQLVPTEINSDCAHNGGTSAKKYEQAWGNVALDY